MNFYVHQYSTGISGAHALANKVLAGEDGAAEAYLGYLKSGSSAYSLDILKEAGVDMTTSDPFDMTIQRMNRVMDEIEAILDK